MKFIHSISSSFPSYDILIPSIKVKKEMSRKLLRLLSNKCTEQEVVCKLKRILEGRCSETGWQHLESRKLTI